MLSASQHMDNIMPVMNYAKKVYLYPESGVRSIWLRHNLENFKKCLKALEAKVAVTALFSAMHKLLDLKRNDDEAFAKLYTIKIPNTAADLTDAPKNG